MCDVRNDLMAIAGFFVASTLLVDLALDTAGDFFFVHLSRTLCFRVKNVLTC